MKPAQKVLTTLLWIVFVLAMVSVIGAGLWNHSRLAGSGVSASDPDDPADSPIQGLRVSQRTSLEPIADLPPFNLIDQDARRVTRETLAGKVWIAAFIFTRCAGPCPMMTSKMAMLQKAIDDPTVSFVSFSVDPEFDRPAVLKSYAKTYGADETRWRFLTGDKDEIFALAKAMLVSAMPASEQNPIIHSEKLILVDSTGKMRNTYDSKDPAAIERLKADVATLARAAATASRPSPTTQLPP
jgi:cytochrome oxidase Cu insertion factor (SCO1/SenC/PrrC family)